MTLAEQYAKTNGWSLAFACGYCDGTVARVRNLSPAVGQFDTDDYSHGYWRSYGASPINRPF